MNARLACVALRSGVYRVAVWVGVASVVLVGALLVFVLIARTALRPAPGAWATTVQMGPMPVEVGVPSLIWLATTPWLVQLADGRTLPTTLGPVQVAWDAQANALSLNCRPCSIRNASWGNEPLRLAEVRLTVQRMGMRLQGTVASGQVLARWRGHLTASSLTLEMDLPGTPVRDGYALFASAIPELGNAALQIDGSFELHATLVLPSGVLTLAPRLQGLAVQGLGTEQWAQARSQCNSGLSERALGARPTAQSLLARAVIAAEDQRFYEHAGFDLVEITHALRDNQRGGVNAPDTPRPATALRGASTLSQQLAKLLVTGGERSPVRKLRELLYAVEMEQTLGKARILGLYLDIAPWGAKLCGARAAAYTYFGKRADRLSASEAAWLAAMLHNPSEEARRWATTGQINEARAQWVARGMRGGGADAPRRRDAKMVAPHGRSSQEPVWRGGATHHRRDGARGLSRV